MKLQEYFTKFTQLLRSLQKSIISFFGRFSKKALWIGAAVVLLIIIIIISVSVIASRSESSQGNSEEAGSKIYDTSQDTFHAQGLKLDTITEKTLSGFDVSVVIPITGEEKTDLAIKNEARKFAQTVGAKAQANQTYVSNSFSYSDYIFVTFSNVNNVADLPAFKTVGFTKKGIITKDLLKGSYEEPITTFVSKEISSRYRSDNALAQSLAITALKEKSYRLASNGLVIQVPANKISEDSGSRYYEILVPNEIVEKYLK